MANEIFFSKVDDLLIFTHFKDHKFLDEAILKQEQLFSNFVFSKKKLFPLLIKTICYSKIY